MRKRMTRSRPMAVVTTTVPISMDRFQRPLIRRLKELGYDVVAISSPGGRLDDVARDEAISAHDIPMVRDIAPMSDLRALLHWLRFILRNRPAVVIAMTPKASLLSMIAARIACTPVRVYQCVGLRAEGATGVKFHLLWATEWLTSHVATRTIANSRSLALRLQQLRLTPTKKLRWTSSDHGVDSSHFRPLPPDHNMAARLQLSLKRPIIGFVGRLTEDKGAGTLRTALAEAHTWPVPPQLLVVGAQDEHDSARWLHELDNLDITVVATGMVEDVRPYFSLMTLHVLPSLREGFPNVVLEASAMQVATITTDATGCVDSLEAPLEGWIVPTKDSAALSAAIKSALENPSDRAARALNARHKVVEHFQPDDVARQTVDHMGLQAISGTT